MLIKVTLSSERVSNGSLKPVGRSHEVHTYISCSQTICDAQKCVLPWSNSSV